MEKNGNKEMSKFRRLFKTSNLLCLAAIVLFFISISFMLQGLVSLLIDSDENVYVYEEGVKYVETEKGLVIRELVLESGAQLPDAKDYFKEAQSISDKASIKYFSMENKEIGVDDFTVQVDNTYFVKGIRDILVTILNNGEEYNASVSILDTTTPQVTVKDLTITEGEEVTPKSFIISYFDNSSLTDYTARFMEDYDFTKPGQYDKVKIETCDLGDNCVETTSKLTVLEKPEEPKPIVKPKDSPDSSASTTTQSVSQKKPNGGTTTNPSGNNGNNGGGNNGNSGNGSVNGNNNYNNGNNITDTTNAQKSTDPNFWKLVDKAKSYIKDPNNASEISKVRDTFITKTNATRAAAGVAPLQLDEDLCIMAQTRIFEYESIGWNESDTYMHKRPDQRDFSTIFKDYGYVAGVYQGQRFYGENYVSVLYGANYNNDGAFNLLRNSSGHYANIVGVFYTKMGIAKGYDPVTHRLFWIQLFAS